MIARVVSKRLKARPREYPLAIDRALLDHRLLGAALGNADSWATWLVVLRAAFGLPLSEPELTCFRSVAGDRTPPQQRVSELWAVIGRRSGKSRVAAAISVHVAQLQKHNLSAGEIGYVLVLSPTTQQAKVVFSYALGFIEQSPVLCQDIESTTAHEIRLKSGIIIATHPNSFRSVRGRSLLACIFDESSFWRDEASALPDVETYRAVLPALATSRGMLIGISSPYRKLGLLYQKHKDYFGVDDPSVLVVQGDSISFNPTLDPAKIAKAITDDPEAAISEWQGLFRIDITAFLSDADIDACIDHDRPLELPPRAGFDYRAFCDPSGGRHDHFAVAIGHKEKNSDRTVIDCLRGFTPPFDPKLAVAQCAALMREYGIREVTGDNYSANWCEMEFKNANIKYVRCEVPKSKLYVEGLPSITRRTVALPDHPRLIRELRLLERRAHIGGKTSVDHGRTGSDDYANSIFGVISLTVKKKQRLRMWVGGIGASGLTELDPRTGKPFDAPERPRVKWVTIPESAAPAVKGLKGFN